MIKITQGDTATLNFTAEDGNGNPIDLTSAVFTTSVRGLQGAEISFPNSQHTANPDQINFRGQFSLALASSDTASIPNGINKEVVTEIVIGATTIFYRGENILTVYLQIPRQ